LKAKSKEERKKMKKERKHEETLKNNSSMAVSMHGIMLAVTARKRKRAAKYGGESGGSAPASAKSKSWRRCGGIGESLCLAQACAASARTCCESGAAESEESLPLWLKWLSGGNYLSGNLTLLKLQAVILKIY